jgi:hypothetical protein
MIPGYGEGRVSTIFLDRLWSLDAIITGEGPPDGMDEDLPPIIVASSYNADQVDDAVSHWEEFELPSE